MQPDSLLCNIALYRLSNYLLKIFIPSDRKPLNEKDLYSLSIYQNFYAGTKLIPDIDNEYRTEYYENGGGENSLALITGCHWIEQTGSSELVE